eukprot:360329-Chlamydomonas_euryale.AAC.4
MPPQAWLPNVRALVPLPIPHYPPRARVASTPVPLTRLTPPTSAPPATGTPRPALLQRSPASSTPRRPPAPAQRPSSAPSAPLAAWRRLPEPTAQPALAAWARRRLHEVCRAGAA